MNLADHSIEPGSGDGLVSPGPAAPAGRVLRDRLPRDHAPRRAEPRTFPRLLYGIATAGWLTLLVYGMPYYRLGPAQRLGSPLHRLLKPNGEIGLLYGYLGTLALLILVAYSVRKRWRFLWRLGKLRRWLNVHIFCGIAAPALITLHSGFKLHGAIAVGYWAMMAVMASGFVGFYLYCQIPRALAVGEDATQSMQEEVETLDAELQRRFGVRPEGLREWFASFGLQRAASMGVLASLMLLIGQDLKLGMGRWPAGILAPELRRLPRRQQRLLRRRMRDRLVLERRQVLLRQTETLFGYWHTIHKPFAILLFVTLSLHIGIAVWLGYAWPWK